MEQRDSRQGSRHSDYDDCHGLARSSKNCGIKRTYKSKHSISDKPAITSRPAGSALNWPSRHTARDAAWYRMLAGHVFETRRPGRRRSRAAYASAGLAGPSGWPSGIVPSCGFRTTSVCGVEKGEGGAGTGGFGYVPWTVILDVVLLDLLDVVICLRIVHSLHVLVGEVS